MFCVMTYFRQWESHALSLQCMLIHIDYRSSTVDIAFITHHSRTIPSSVSRIYVICLFLKRFVTSKWLEMNFSACKKNLKSKKQRAFKFKKSLKTPNVIFCLLMTDNPKQNILYFYFTLEIYFNFRCCRHRHFILSFHVFRSN